MSIIGRQKGPRREWKKDRTKRELTGTYMEAKLSHNGSPHPGCG